MNFLWLLGTDGSECHSEPIICNFPEVTTSRNADSPLSLQLSSCYYPCPSPLSVLGVAFSPRARGQASIFRPAVRCLRLEGLLKPNTVHYRSTRPPSCGLPLPPGTSPLPAPLDTLHSCCHSALSQSQFIPSSWPYRDMHSPGRRGWGLGWGCSALLHTALLQARAGVFPSLNQLHLDTLYWFPAQSRQEFWFTSTTAVVDKYKNHHLTTSLPLRVIICVIDLFDRCQELNKTT